MVQTRDLSNEYDVNLDRVQVVESEAKYNRGVAVNPVFSPACAVTHIDWGLPNCQW